MEKENRVEFKVSGKYALFTDPLTKIGGEKCSYHIPTYESLKGVLGSVYWKPTIVWIIDCVRVMKHIRTQTRSAKPMNFLASIQAYETELKERRTISRFSDLHLFV